MSQPQHPQSEIEQALTEELASIAESQDATNDAIKELDQRLRRLEDQEPSDGSAPSGNSPDRSEERREMFFRFLVRLKRKHPKNEQEKEDFQILQKNPPLCITCQHATLTDGSVMQPTGDKDTPAHSYSGFVDCAKIIGQPMPFRTAPIKHCMHRMYDNGGRPRVPKDDSSQG